MAVVVLERMKTVVEALMEGLGRSLVVVVEEVWLRRVSLMQQAVGGAVSTSLKELAGLVMV